jgi:nitrogen regulatory protein PII
MKEIKAFIKPHKLDDVTIALHKIKGLTGMSVSDIKGFGRGRGKNQNDPVGPEENHLSFQHKPFVRIEIICRDELSANVVTAIKDTAHTGLRGDGKIYVSDIKMAVRISTGETGDKAV